MTVKQEKLFFLTIFNIHFLFSLGIFFFSMSCSGRLEFLFKKNTMLHTKQHALDPFVAHDWHNIKCDMKKGSRYFVCFYLRV
jgi:hypothetical protein